MLERQGYEYMENTTKTTGAVCFCGQGIVEELSFEAVLLDETLVRGDVWVLKEALQQVGGMNYRLQAKRNYELLIRIAKDYTVLRGGEENRQDYFPGEEKQESGKWIRLPQESSPEDGVTDPAEEMKTDCYLIGRYKQELISMNSFNAAVLSVYQVGGESAVAYLEQMLGETKAYYDIYGCTQPILIYIGNDVCYSILDVFSRGLGDALKNLGQNVEYYDFSKRGIEELGNYVRRKFKAVIGVQTYMFSVQRESGILVHDEIDAPLYQFVFDHPISFWMHLKKVPKRLCVLTLDGNYVNFIKTWLGYKARFFPPAGEEKFCNEGQRDYELTFLGGLASYGEGLVRKLWDVRKQDRQRGFLLNRYVLYMRKNLDKPPEYAFEKVLEYYREDYSREEFWQMFYNERWVFRGVSQYYRNKTIEILLCAGICVHVYGDGWENSYLWGNPGLIHHEAVMGDEALKVYARSKLSLNVMSWHKDGFTERIANAMLQKSVVVTDRTTYLEQNFVNGEDLLMFDLGNLRALPDQIRALLDDEAKRTQMAENAYVKAASRHTWKQRAEKLLEFMEEDQT